MEVKKKVFPEETWGQNGILENFRGSGKVKAEYLVTLVNKNVSSRLKPLLLFAVFVFESCIFFCLYMDSQL